MLTLILTMVSIGLFFYSLGLINDRNNWRNLAERYRADFIRLANENTYNTYNTYNNDNMENDWLTEEERAFDEEFANDTEDGNIIDFPKGNRRDN